MKRTLYLECSFGISGDMAVGMLLDLGADVDVLKEALSSLPIDGFKIQIGRVQKAGLNVCDFAVLLDEDMDNHDHDMQYLYGKESGEEPDFNVADHRSLSEILGILAQAQLTQGARDLAVRIFKILAEAEAQAHGTSVEEVHFHEVGAIDSIVDITAAAVCFDNLGIEEVIVPRISDGKGFVRCRHGKLPVPVPAVVNIVQKYELPLSITDVEGELVTPTGAAILAAICTGRQLPASFTITKTGMGAGKRMYEVPSLLRGMLIYGGGSHEESICKLECNMDDCTGEAMGYAMTRLMEAGARDVHYFPVFMKKNRPAYQLNVICDKEKVPALEQVIFEETTTLGIRHMEMERTVLERECRTVSTTLGEARVKVSKYQGETRFYPEYDSVARLAREHQLPFQKVYELVLGACEEA